MPPERRTRRPARLTSAARPGVVTVLATVVYAVAGLPAVFLAALVPWYRGETEYCVPPDDSGPCDRIETMSAGGAALLVSAALALLVAGLVALTRGRHLATSAPGREGQGVALALAALVAPLAAVALLAYGYV